MRKRKPLWLPFPSRPRKGAWIEIRIKDAILFNRFRRPRKGAWIEMYSIRRFMKQKTC